MTSRPARIVRRTILIPLLCCPRELNLQQCAPNGRERGLNNARVAHSTNNVTSLDVRALVMSDTFSCTHVHGLSQSSRTTHLPAWDPGESLTPRNPNLSSPSSIRGRYWPWFAVVVTGNLLEPHSGQPGTTTANQ